jgi:phosphate butyryltransferase
MILLSELFDIAKNKGIKKIAVAAADDKNVLLSIKSAIEKNLIQPVLIGNEKNIQSISTKIEFEITNFELIDCQDPVEISQIAVDLVNSGNAQIIMKGLIPTAAILRSIVKKENGLLSGNLLSHFAISQVPSYPKLLAFTDGAMNIYPDLHEKEQIIQNALNILYKLGYSNPKVAIICPLETVNPKIESTVHALKLKELNQKQILNNCIIDGPFALDNAISKESAKHKGITGEVAGDADLLIVPNLDTGNVLYKSINFLAGGITAAIITGAKVPIVLTSRSDSESSKLYSIALAACV